VAECCRKAAVEISQLIPAARARAPGFSSSRGPRFERPSIHFRNAVIRVVAGSCRSAVATAGRRLVEPDVITEAHGRSANIGRPPVFVLLCERRRLLDREDLAMRKALIPALFSAVFTVNSNAMEQGGVIVSVDRASQTFTVRWATAERTYTAGDKMVIRVGEKKGAWSDLKPGTKVNISFHPVDNGNRVAYDVQIVP
jgi:hypothetical protein